MRRLLPLALLFLAGCKARDADLLAQVIARTHARLQAAVGDAPLRMAGKLRGSIADAGIVSRVQLRLAWDRYLDGTELAVESPAEGVVRLRGQVPDLKTKERVLDLTRATRGVDKVEEEITLPAEK